MRDKYADIPVQFKQQHFDKIREYKDKLYKEPELRSLFLELTLNCNEHCLHCGSNCGDNELVKGLSDNEIIQTLIQLKKDLHKQDRYLPFLNITGGEPMLRPHMTELMTTLNMLGYKWGMTSNGSLITPEAARELKKSGMYSISISLDGLRDTHDWFRQTPGAYDSAIAAVENLIAADIEKVKSHTIYNHRQDEHPHASARVARTEKTKTQYPGKHGYKHHVLYSKTLHAERYQQDAERLANL